MKLSLAVEEMFLYLEVSRPLDWLLCFPQTCEAGCETDQESTEGKRVALPTYSANEETYSEKKEDWAA
jgi:hypothetical protein